MNIRGPWIEHLMQDEGLSYPDASALLDGWEFHPYVEDGEHMATLIKRGAEVHFAIYRQYRHQGNITARRLRAFFLPILESEGFLTTKLGESDKTEGFIKRLGFVEMGRTSAGQKTYILTSIKPLENEACNP